MAKSAADKLVGHLAKALDAGEGDAEDASLSDSPLFALRGDGENKLDSITVIRLGPVSEGTIGKLGADGSEEEILRRWGGGKYRLVGKNDRGKPIKGAFETVELAGEPKLKTRAARNEYRRMLAEGDDLEPAKAAGGFGIEQVLLVLTKQDASRREEWERRQTEQERQHQREIERLRLEQKEREEARRADREREREERRLEDDRRRKDDEERERRQKRDFEEAQRRDRDYFATMEKITRERLSTGTPKADPVDLLMKGIDLARKLGPSDGDTDPTTEIVRQIPGLLKVGGEMVQAAVRREPAAAPAPVVARGTPQSPVTPPVSVPAAPLPTTAAELAPDQVLFDGELGAAVRAAVENLVRQGIEPEAALTRVFRELAAARQAPAAASPAAAPSSAPVAAPPPGAAASLPDRAPAPVSPPVASATVEPKSATS